MFDLYTNLSVWRKDERRGHWARGIAYRYLEVDEFLRKGTHPIVEAELVLSFSTSSEHEVALSLFLPIQYNLLVRPCNLVIDIKGSASLHLFHPN